MSWFCSQHRTNVDGSAEPTLSSIQLACDFEYVERLGIYTSTSTGCVNIYSEILNLASIHSPGVCLLGRLIAEVSRSTLTH